MLLIGYSSYAMVLIRSNANTPINMSAPDDPLKLSDYLARKQYGEVAPLVFGRYYVDQPINIKEESSHRKNIEQGEYEEKARLAENTQMTNSFQECTVRSLKTT